MLLKEWGEKATTLVEPWVILGRDARVITIFSQIMSSQQIVAPHSFSSVGEDVVASLTLLGIDSNDPVKIVINSPGGHVDAGFMIIQAMNHLKAKGIEVWTVDLCRTMSMGGIILMMGTKGRRYAMENTLIHTHFGKRSISGESQADIDEAIKYTEAINQTIYRYMSENSNIPEFHIKRQGLDGYDPAKFKDLTERIKVIKNFLNNETLMSPEEAREAGIIDKVLSPGDPIIDQIYSKQRSG